jgi:hypothetical protein
MVQYFIKLLVNKGVDAHKQGERSNLRLAMPHNNPNIECKKIICLCLQQLKHDIYTFHVWESKNVNIQLKYI